jgi:hypothetical protein
LISLCSSAARLVFGSLLLWLLCALLCSAPLSDSGGASLSALVLILLLLIAEITTYWY